MLSAPTKCAAKCTEQQIKSVADEECRYEVLGQHGSIFYTNRACGQGSWGHACKQAAHTYIVPQQTCVRNTTLPRIWSLEVPQCSSRCKHYDSWHDRLRPVCDLFATGFPVVPEPNWQVHGNTLQSASTGYPQDFLASQSHPHVSTKYVWRGEKYLFNILHAKVQ